MSLFLIETATEDRVVSVDKTEYKVKSSCLKNSVKVKEKSPLEVESTCSGVTTVNVDKPTN